MSLFSTSGPGATVGTKAVRLGNAQKISDPYRALSATSGRQYSGIGGAPAAKAPAAPVNTTPVTGTAGNLTTPDPTRILDELRGMFPWLSDIGIDPKWFQEVAAETGGNADAALVRFRELPQYRQRFPGLWRKDGSLRMNEAQYIATENSYRTLLRQSGISDDQFKQPGDLLGLFESEIDPNELSQRLGIWRNVKAASQPVKDAFYVYAGIDLSDDDLFEAAIDPRMASRISGAYVENVSGQNFNYEQFIDRVTEVAGQRAARLVQMSDNTLTVNTHDPGRARQVLDLLYTDGGSGTSQPVNLEELLASYEEALLGAAASNAGLEIPTKERVGELRIAGVQRAQAQQAYLQYALQGGGLSAASERIGRGRIDQTSFENAVFFGRADEARSLRDATLAEEAAGERQGQFRFDQDQTGRFVQRGMTT